MKCRNPWVIRLMLALCLLAPHVAAAQGSWTVEVTPTLNPLPVGLCGAIHLAVFDGASQGVPRNPLGFLVTIADFDIAVTAPGGGTVIARQIDQSHWVSCACRSATAGTVATVTATYPARLLAVSARVPGVAIQRTASFTVSLPKGTTNPFGCASGAAGTVASSSGAGAAAAPPPGTTAGTIAASSGAGATAAAAPPIAAPVAVQPPPTRTAVAPQPVPVAPPGAYPGPAPDTVIVTGTPALTTVAWDPVPGATGYSVERWTLDSTYALTAQSPMLPASATTWDDPLQTSGWWMYWVTAHSPGNLAGRTFGYFRYTALSTPPGFKAVQTGDGSVELSWKPVSNATYYVLAGPPTNQAERVNGTTATVTGVPTGNNSWQVSSMYDTDGVHRAGSALVSTSVDVRPSGRYRISVESIRVVEQTWDTDVDGMGDEVYVSAYVGRLDRTGAVLKAADLVSAIHGDALKWPAPARVARGSASGMGGLKTNDVIPVVGQMVQGGWPKFVLWEGVLTDGIDKVLVAPMLWESDNDVRYYQGWRLWVAAALPSLLNHPAVVADASAPDLNFVDAGEFKLNLMQSWDRDRPLGITAAHINQGLVIGSDTQFLDLALQRVVILTREKIEADLSATTSFGGREPGLIPMAFTDTGAWAGPGNYMVYLRVVRLP